MFVVLCGVVIRDRYSDLFLFSLLGKPADRATYFADVFSLFFFYFFNGRLSNTCSSAPNGAIFTKISGFQTGVRACSSY